MHEDVDDDAEVSVNEEGIHKEVLEEARVPDPTEGMGDTHEHGDTREQGATYE